MTFSRKEFLRLGLVGEAGLLLPSGLAGCVCSGGGGNNSCQGSAGVMLESAAELPELPVLDPVRSDATSDYYEIT